MLMTNERRAEGAWPRESIDELFIMPDLWKREDMIHTVSYLARTRPIERIVALDDYDVEMAAILREHLRIPGMGSTTGRYLRDKLAMRLQADEHGILVPEFVHVLNYDRLREFMERIPPPWILKPRTEAATFGIRKVPNSDELWSILEGMGDRQSYYVLERFVPGDVYHVDAITYEREVLFAEVHKYGKPPFNVAHEGDIFTSRTLPRDSAEVGELRELNKKLLDALNFVRGVTHTEFIKGHEDGRFYFLETAARVGGAYLVEMVEASTGINMWAEWAKVEVAGGKKPYEVPPHQEDYAGILVSLARHEYPDTSAYTDPEIVWRLKKQHHVGLIVASPSHERVAELLESYARRFHEDFFARQPLPERPPD
jgi:biotin carboxylase